ncbi:MAG: DNA-processing protein DprA [Pseudomonadota bacterium]
MVQEYFPSPPPLTPPLTVERKLSCLRLLRSRRVGPTTYHRLVAEHGGPEAALDALPKVAADAGVKNYEACTLDAANEEYEAGLRAGATLICHGDPAYPDHLARLDDAPPILWALGNVDLLKQPLLSIVGARNASSLGTRMAKKLGHELGEAGFVIVSGLARGVDAAAHLGAIDTGTIAVLAGGVDVVYPAENSVLAQEIAQKGLRLSEQPMHLTAQARHFPARNRIVAGLGRALVVVEAAGKSGSLITARQAADQGRDVLAVPGHPFDARAAGCNMLIRDGATLVRGARDVIESLGSPQNATVPAVHHKVPVAENTQSLHAEILDRLGPSPIAEDQLIRDLSKPAGEVGPALVALELDGRIERRAGGFLSVSVPD